MSSITLRAYHSGFWPWDPLENLIDVSHSATAQGGSPPATRSKTSRTTAAVTSSTSSKYGPSAGADAVAGLLGLRR